MNLKSKAWVTCKEMKEDKRIEKLFVDYYGGSDARTIVVTILVNGAMYQGMATTNPKDKYVKELGREIAAGRCLKNLENGIFIPEATDDCPF